MELLKVIYYLHKNRNTFFANFLELQPKNNSLSLTL